ncbi:MAG: hypothetical protein KDE56_01995 [Anaerolineales bacterium]|nr:hypothetical protein [Anaerolineales bacterium]
MRAVEELERLGYVFTVSYEPAGKQICYTHQGAVPDAETVRPLMQTLKTQRGAAIQYLHQRRQTGTRAEHLNYVIKVRIEELAKMIRELEPADQAWQRAAKEYDRLHRDFVNPKCPRCWREVMSVAAFTSNTPGQPDNPFWGKSGERFIKCQVGKWCHFVANGQHRLAYLAQLDTM